MSLEPISAQEMMAIEDNAEYLGVSKCQLMECAGLVVAEKIVASGKGNKCMVFSGVGKNGGDGMVAARHLASMGFKVSIALLGSEEKIFDPNVKSNWEILKKMRSTVEICVVRDSSLLPEISTPIVVDALLGIGVRGKLNPPILQAVQAINKAESFCVAVDIPTGLDATTGEILGGAVKADLTVTFHRPKIGLLQAKEYAGEIVVVDVGIPKEAEIYAGPGDVKKTWIKRPATSHKGDFGRLLVVGGSETFTGAPALTGLAALKTGVDLVYVASPRKTAQIISSFSPNLITLKLDGDHLNIENIGQLKPFLAKVTALVVGPGLETEAETFEAVGSLIKEVEEAGLPLLLDADGLKAFSQFKHSLKTGCVITPHAGEYKILTEESVSSNLEEMGEQVRKTAGKLDVIVLLKGNVDVVSDGRRVKFNWTGNPGMTVGGTGDVLSGIVGGFLAQGINPFDAAVAGAFVNGAAGDFVAKKKGYHMVPTDLLDEIPILIENPMSHTQVRG